MREAPPSSARHTSITRLRTVSRDVDVEEKREVLRKDLGALCGCASLRDVASLYSVQNVELSRNAFHVQNAFRVRRTNIWSNLFLLTLTSKSKYLERLRASCRYFGELYQLRCM